jgi:hypothetical protein
MTSTPMRSLLLASLVTASACQSRETLEAETRAPGAPVEESADHRQPAPPVKDCLLRALGDPGRQALFAPRRPVEIAAARLPDGSVRVAFSLPVSRLIVSEGRKSTRLEDETIFTARSVSQVRRYLRGPEDPPVDPSTSEALARAIRTVCGELSDADTMEFAVSASEEPDGFSVLVEVIPYTPGGHTFFRLSRDFAIVRVSPGE